MLISPLKVENEGMKIPPLQTSSQVIAIPPVTQIKLFVKIFARRDIRH